MPSKSKRPSSPSNLIWKIRRPTDGLFSSGLTSYPKFSKEGRCFYSEQKLLTHINMVNRYFEKAKKNRWWGGPVRPHPYLGCEIVQFKLVEEVSIPLESYGE